MSSLEELSRLVEKMMAEGPIFHPDGSVTLTRKLIVQYGSVRIEVRPNEHPPPHFHAIGPGINASFAIADGSKLDGKGGRNEIRIVECCYSGARDLFIQAWNETRPSNCPVGMYFEE